MNSPMIRYRCRQTRKSPCCPPLAQEVTGKRNMVQLTREPIDYLKLTEQVRRPNCGGVVTFLGTVRDLTDGRTTAALDYEAYPAMAEKKMAEIERETRDRWS